MHLRNSHILWSAGWFATVAAAWLIVGVSLIRWIPDATVASMVVAGFTALAALLIERQSVSHVTRWGGNDWSLSGTVAVVMVLAMPLEWAVVAWTVCSVVQDLLGRRAVRVVFGNVALMVVPMAVGGMLWDALGGSHRSLDLPADYLGGIVVALLVVLLNAVLFAVETASMSKESPARAFLDDVNDLFVARQPVGTFEALAGVAIGFIIIDNPALTPLLIPFAASVYLMMRKMNEVEAVTDRALESFASVVDERDTYTFEHSTRVCEYSVMIGEQLGYSERQLKSLYWTSRLHDLGKVAVDNAILNKPGKLTDEEFEVMKSHPVVSARILSAFSFTEMETEIVLCHHERWDGYGYLRREVDNVPFDAFIIAVADAYDAMTSERPYRAAMPHVDALSEIARNAGTQFHPEIAPVFVAAMRERLGITSEQIAAVIDLSPGRLPEDIGDDVARAA